MNKFYSDNYSSAREAFITSSNEIGAKLFKLVIDKSDSSVQNLSIDIAWIGNINAKKVVIHSSGLHGVEGFAGSAIQLKVLNQLPSLAKDTALILVHILNPFGMANLRRVNEDNIDLNRNFMKDSEHWKGISPIYEKLESTINPEIPLSNQSFILKSIFNIARYGFSNIGQALAEGQYENNTGLFYGGKELSQGLKLYKSFIYENLKNTEKIIVIDLHTGLGKFAEDQLIVYQPKAEIGSYEEKLNRLFTYPYESKKGGYRAKGPLASLFLEFHENALFITQEFGTYPTLKVLKALIDENQHHNYGNQDLNHISKTNLRNIFFPNSLQWQTSVLDKGIAFIQKAVEII